MDGGAGKSMRAFGVALAVAVGIGVLGCGAQPVAPDQFLAFASSFNGFRDWPSAPAMPSPNLPPVPGGDGVVLPDAGVGDAGTTDAGVVHRLPLTVYWNQAPPHGSTKFPLGTIIV
jgi:hypothetical protein